MLQIYLISEPESGFLDIAPGATLDIESLSDAFDEDLTLGEFSLPLDLPWTPRNRRLTRFAERITNNNKTTTYFKVNVYDDGFPELVNAKMVILEKTGTFNSSKGKFSVTISGTKGLFGSLIYNKKLADLNLGPAINFTESSSRDFATALMKGMYPQFNFLSFAPVAIENYFDTSRPDYNNEFLAEDTVNTVVVTGPGADDWEFGRPDATNPNVSVTSGNADFNDFRTVPFLNFKYVLQKLFTTFGFTGSGALLSDTFFNDLFIFNTYSIDNLPGTAHTGAYTDFNRNIFFQYHLPDMLVKDFLKTVFSFFKVFPSFNGNKINLKYKQKLIENRSPVAFTNNCAPEFDSNVQDDTVDGYTVAYNWDSNDQYYSDRVKDLKDKVIVGTVVSRNDLITLNINRAFTTNDVVLVQNENLYYCVADATTTPVKWDCYAESLDSYIKAGGERSADIGLSTLCQYASVNAANGLYERKNYVGTRQSGCYINDAGVRVINPFGLRLFYIKKYPDNAVNIPQSYNHNTMPDGNFGALYSLALNAGFANNFHTAWEDLKTNMEIVKVELAANKKATNTYTNADCLEINSVHFLPYKTERSIPATSRFSGYLVPL